jgi:glycosyltransferase involved in cell wall biosynthesis
MSGSTPETTQRRPEFSVVIPVFNSERIVGRTIDQVAEFFEAAQLSYEIVLVNDGSRDGSWRVIADKAAASPHIVAIDLLGNYGQHAANMCGFRRTCGNWVITMDDDLQNPPGEIAKLIEKSAEGHDLVIGEFRQKRHSLYRRLGSRLINEVNARVFRKPQGLVLSNFRMIRRDVMDRVCAYQTAQPYIPGLTLMFSGNPANTVVEHHARAEGESNYSMVRILRLVATILFNYSSWPLRFVAGFGAVVTLVALLLGSFYLVRGLVYGSEVPGWTTLVVLLAFFNGVLTLMLSMLGEYTVRLLNQVTSSEGYQVREIVG